MTDETSSRAVSPEGRPYFLVIGSATDGQLSGVLDLLRARGIEVRFIDHDDPPDFCLTIDACGRPHFEVDGASLPEPPMLWFRAKLRPVIAHWSEETIPVYLARSEWLAFLGGLLAHYSDRLVHPGGLYASGEFKLRQLIVAGEVGFEVPTSHFVLGKRTALERIKEGRPYVAKVIGNPDVPAQSGDIGKYRRLKTMGVFRSEIEAADNEEFSSAPIFFQRRLLEGTEYRVIAFPDRCFAYSVVPRLEDKVYPDERFLLGGEVDGKPLYGAQYRKASPTAQMERLTSAYLGRLGLAYGAFDIVVDDVNRHHFIECNPEGQWFAASRFDMDDVIEHFAASLEGRIRSFRAGDRVARAEGAM